MSNEIKKEKYWKFLKDLTPEARLGWILMLVAAIIFLASDFLTKPSDLEGYSTILGIIVMSLAGYYIHLGKWEKA